MSRKFTGDKQIKVVTNMIIVVGYGDSLLWTEITYSKNTQNKGLWLNTALVCGGKRPQLYKISDMGTIIIIYP